MRGGFWSVSQRLTSCVNTKCLQTKKSLFFKKAKDLANPNVVVVDSNQSIHLHGSIGISNGYGNRYSTSLKRLFKVLVHSSVHSPGLLGDIKASSGFTLLLKSGMNGEAHRSRPRSCYNSWRLLGSCAPNQLLRLFLAKQ